MTTDAPGRQSAERERAASTADGGRDGRGRYGRHPPPFEAGRADGGSARASSCSSATGAALPDRRRRDVRRAEGQGPIGGADGGPAGDATSGSARRGQQVRAGEAQRALATYQAHDRLHIADTREQAAEQMVATGTAHGSRPGGADSDAHRRLEQGARPDQREGAGVPRAGTESSARDRGAPRPPVRRGGGRPGDLHRAVQPAGPGAGPERHAGDASQQRPRRASSRSRPREQSSAR